MDVKLTNDEVSALLEAMNSYIPSLREEIGKTENYDMREELKATEAALKSVVGKLGGSLSGGESNLGASNPPWGGH